MASLSFTRIGFALLVAAEPYEWSWFIARLARVGPEGGMPETTYTIPEKQFGCPRVSPGNCLIAALAGFAWSTSMAPAKSSPRRLTS